MNSQKKLTLISLTVVAIALAVVGPLYIVRKINENLINETVTLIFVFLFYVVQ